nr:carboxymuconolactone decarboxylase family protein [Microbacterium ginsengiterrae]
MDSAAERSGHLDPKTRAFVRIALNATMTHLAPHATRCAIRDAVAAGATHEEIVEVLFVACTISVHAMNADVLAEVLEERGERTGPAPLSEAQERIRADFAATRGYWRDFLDLTLELAPDFLDAYLAFSGAPWEHGVLEPKVREFLYLAFDTSATHLHMTGLRIHMHNALDHGATPEEIVEVMTIAAGMGLQSLDLAMPILSEEFVSD